ncbi:MAG: DUF1622 domain-containing protein [Gammaproteobacteria bacterium]
MDELFTNAVSVTGYAIEAVGVVIVTVGFIIATWRVLSGRTAGAERFENYRRELGRSMLLGLEFLVAGDIIRTVIVDHSMESILALSMIVLIRTVLVFTIHLEVHGYWPWNPPLKDD